MKEFPKLLNPNNKARFSRLYQVRLTCYLRRELYEHIISHEEHDYFSVDGFRAKHEISDQKVVESVFKVVITELQELGWKCQLSFGGSGLFVYANEKPKNCWEDSTFAEV